MTAADELERMAEEFRGRFDTCVAHARRVGDKCVEYGIFMAKADAFLEVETELRARAAELRGGSSLKDGTCFEAVVDRSAPVTIHLPSPEAWPAGEAILVSAGVEPVLVEVPAGHAIELTRPEPPKPDRVEVGQWWVHDTPSGKAMLLDEIQRDEAMMRYSQWRRVRVLLSDLLTDPRWRYLGKAENAGGSEVDGGKVER